jgi:cereblon
MSVFLLDAPRSPRSTIGTKLATEQVTHTSGRAWLCCRACGTRVARREAELARGELPLIFANPHGMLFELVLLRKVESVLVVGEPSLEATWFDGYAWTVTLCRTCLNHLGWNYGRVSSGPEPAVFFGLIRRELVESEEEGESEDGA